MRIPNLTLFNFKNRIFSGFKKGQHMKQTTGRLIIFLFIIAAATGGTGSSVLAQEFFVLTPVHASETKDFYNYSPVEALDDIQYFIVVCAGMETQITTLTVKLSATPTLKDYEGRVTYALFVVGIPGIYFFDTATATDSTASSSSIKVDFSINANFGFALVGAMVLSRTEVDDEVKMTLKCSVE